VNKAEFQQRLNYHYVGVFADTKRAPFVYTPPKASETMRTPPPYRDLWGRSKPLTACRLCGSSDLTPYLDLGMQPLADAFVTDRNAAEISYPLVVLQCGSCGFSQLSIVVHDQELFAADYPYEASTTPGGVEHFAALAKDAVARLGLAPGAIAIDVGANDGVLLSGLKAAGLRAVGIEPVERLAIAAGERGFDVVPSFFSGAAISVALQVAEAGQADLITATNVFAHIDDLHTFMGLVNQTLRPDGTLLIESPHLLRLVQHCEWDTIYHEHLSYLTIVPLIPFFAQHGFEIFDMLHTGIHGGSIRLFVGRINQHTVSPRVYQAVDEEWAEQIGSLRTLEQFAESVDRAQDSLRHLIWSLRREGARIAGVSAPAKGMTLVNATGIGPQLEFLTERGAAKLGRFAPGSRLEVLPDEALVERGVTHALILAWNFGQEIAHRQEAFTAAGGQFLVPIPAPRLLEKVA
jgi:hypothetical protein